MNVKIIEGNVLETLKDIPACSVQCAVTSPPYYGLRDYGMDGQIGMEETPEAYVEKLVAVFGEVRRVLKDDGTLWLNLGDSYANNPKSGGKQSALMTRGEHKRTPINRKYYRPDGLKPKDLIGIPWMVAFALRADGWYLRQDIIWNKPNPMPESVTDRCTKAHEYIFLLSKSKSYYYDAKAIAEPSLYPNDLRAPKGSVGAWQMDGRPADNNAGRIRDNNFTRNKRDVWTVTTKPYKGAHFATFPPDLIKPCILAGTREGDTVLDPFNGSGTTGEVSIRHNRFYIGCEINPEYIELTNCRLSKVQPYMKVEQKEISQW